MKRKSLCTKTSLVGRSPASPLARRVMLGGIALTLGLAAITSPARAEATMLYTASVLQPVMVTVYLYDADGMPVPTTDAYLDEGGVYTDTGFVGTVQADDTIVDADNNIVGYVTYTGPH